LEFTGTIITIGILLIEEWLKSLD
jgi:hypothetical protein